MSVLSKLGVWMVNIRFELLWWIETDQIRFSPLRWQVGGQRPWSVCPQTDQKGRVATDPRSSDIGPLFKWDIFVWWGFEVKGQSEERLNGLTLASFLSSWKHLPNFVSKYCRYACLHFECKQYPTITALNLLWILTEQKASFSYFFIIIFFFSGNANMV